MSFPITYLFVPGNRPDRFDKAFSTSAGVVILDLEDAVIPADKAVARDHIARCFRNHPEVSGRIAVRINDSESEWFPGDLAWLRSIGIPLVMLPKSENRQQIETVIGNGPDGVRVLALVETARGIRNVDEIAETEGVQRLVFGTLDYAVDLDLTGENSGLAYASARIAIASRCAELPSPVAGVTPSIKDIERIKSDFAFARNYGFAAKLCIHPAQIDIVHAACLPTAADQAWAQRVMQAARSSDGAVQLDGKMIDRPVVLKAQAILARSDVSAAR
ncbi:HpcH/HpaI aldolase/citrate lyase family protein [Granulosicoccus sp. 3-233]|uniref:HpcH/HpaI aldolase/citrate lyase family protein n=1 Tax=Granulosicoccus sp. 3-233 TaxID=3417969 RepID=UPI003D33918E